MKAHNETLIGRVVFGPAPESGLGSRIQPVYAVCTGEPEPSNPDLLFAALLSGWILRSKLDF